MKLVSSLLLSSVAAFAVVGAQAADLPSKKAAPATYVKICDAFGAGFFYIPGTDTCIKVGGYARAEYQYTPGKNVFTMASSGNTALAQLSSAQDTSGMEFRGRLEADARTQTAWGTARTFVRLRMTNQTGLRGNKDANNGVLGPNVAAVSTTSATLIGNQVPTLESASVQWAGFTFGIAPNNYAFMPSIFYTGNAWAGFPNGQKQIAYTATFGGGFSATLAIEDRNDWAYTKILYAATPSNQYNVSANLRWDQPWGWAIVHGTAGNNSLRSDYLSQQSSVAALTGIAVPAYSAMTSSTTKTGYSVGATVNFKLPMLGAGDQMWLTANYERGMIGGVLSTGGLNNLSDASGGRVLGGIGRIDSNVTVTSLANGVATVGVTSGWNLAGALVHNWTGNWRSQAKAGYVSLSPATTSLSNQWGTGTVWEVSHSLIFSPVKDFDIGLEVQYMNMKNKVQNSTATTPVQGLSDSGWTSKLRVERQF